MSLSVQSLSNEAPTDHHQNKLRSPIAVLKELDRHQWLMFAVGFLGWTWDSFDFFTVSLTVTEIAADFGKPAADVTWVSADMEESEQSQRVMLTASRVLRLR